MKLLIFGLILGLAVAEEVRLVELEPNEAEQYINKQDLSLRYAPKIESSVPALRVLGKEQHQVLEDIYLANQYHGQDGLGAYAYGYSVPDIAKAEKKNRGGDLKGAYSYINQDGQEIKVEYWDDGTGFHQIDNVPQIQPQQVDDTPEVKAAKEEHLRIWNEQAIRNSQAPEDPNANYDTHSHGYGQGHNQGQYQPQAFGASSQSQFQQNPFLQSKPGQAQGAFSAYGGSQPKPQYGQSQSHGSGSSFPGQSQSHGPSSQFPGLSQTNPTGSQIAGQYQSHGSSSQFSGQAQTHNPSSPFPGQNAGSQFPGKPGESPFAGQHAGSQLPGQSSGSPFPGQNAGSQFPGKPGGSPFAGQHAGSQLPGQSSGSPFPGQHAGSQFSGQSSGSQFSGQHTGSQFPGQSSGSQFSGQHGGSQFPGQSQTHPGGSQFPGQSQAHPGGSQFPGKPPGGSGQSQSYGSQFGGQSQYGGHQSQFGTKPQSLQPQYQQYGGPSQVKQGYGQSGPFPGNQNSIDYSGQYSEAQKTYAQSPSLGVNKEWKDEDEGKYPPKGFFYSFDYPVGIIVSKQGSKDLHGTYNQNKDLFEKQLRGQAPAPAGASNSYHTA